VIYHGRGGDPEAIRVISLAFTHACSRLGLVHKSDGATQLVAKKIIEAAERGQRDHARMVSAVLTHFAR
jgi:hypothetical protein